MILLLEPHPASAVPAIRIEAEAERTGAGRLSLRYGLTGSVADLQVPPSAPPDRADGLWRHTCFEAFVRARAEAGYFEINLSPSGQWAVYRFSDYRGGMAPVVELLPPQLKLETGTNSLELSATVDLEPALGLLDQLPWQVGLAAVIEDRSGRISHWALAHPPGRPDFHHDHCFALELPPPEAR